MSYKIKHARKTMRKAFKKDRNFYYGYKANVAMILYDELDVFDKENRNLIADLILKKIFDL